MRASVEELLDLLRAEKVSRELLPGPSPVLRPDPPHDLGVFFIVPEVPLVEPLEGGSEIDLRPVLVVGLLDFRQNPLDVGACWINKTPPQ